ncbi:MAG: DUF3619 family protein [Gammaproteobacteria bacterium]|nr:DUF3619 family protein [Gammaproteobacteria bacterium]
MSKHNPDDNFTNKITQQLDTSITDLDDNIKQRLLANRQNAIAKTNRHAEQSFFTLSLSNINWQQSGVFAVTAILIVTASITLFSTDQQSTFDRDKNIYFTADYDVDDDAIIAEYELLDDLEFIAWLVDEENDNDAS